MLIVAKLPPSADLIERHQMDNKTADAGKLGTQPNNIGQPQGKLGTYTKAPPMDRNHVMEEKGVGTLTQLGFDSKLGA